MKMVKRKQSPFGHGRRFLWQTFCHHRGYFHKWVWRICHWLTCLAKGTFITNRTLARKTVHLVDTLSSILARVAAAFTHVRTNRTISSVSTIADTPEWANDVCTCSIWAAQTQSAFIDICRESVSKNGKLQELMQKPDNLRGTSKGKHSHWCSDQIIRTDGRNDWNQE